jgi:uncharacterized membrane protein
MHTDSNLDNEPERIAALVTWTNVIYGLHALSVLIGVTSAATIAGSFIFGVPSIAAVILNYAKRSEVRDTWLASHFSWQIRTFWFAFLWSLLVLIVSAPLMFILIGFATAWMGIVLVGLWVAYRVLRGWVALRDRRPLPMGGA